MALVPSSPVAPKWDRIWWQRQAEAAAPALLSLVCATAVFLIGWRGVDQAAQTYRVLEFRAHGLTLWDSNWYGGNFPMGYSVLFPPVAGLLGLDVVAIASAVLATWSFDRVIKSYLGSRPLGTWYFAVSIFLPVAIGQWTFLAGEAVGLAALVALQRQRRPLAVVLGITSALFSPLAAAFLAMVCLAWAAYASRRRKGLIITAVTCLLVIGLCSALFPGTGPFPYPWESLAVTELLCLTALTPLVQTTPAVRLGALIYAAASLFSFIVPNALGGNASRLAASIGVPLLACFLTAPGPALERLSHARFTRWAARGRNIRLSTRWRAAAVVVVVPFALWQWAPTRLIVTDSSAPENQAAFYQPLLHQLNLIDASGPIRLEIPPTEEHWESAYVAPYVSLARGWERQLDIADNPLFYTQGMLTSAAYEQWLDGNGVSYVALANAPLDYAANDEAALIRSGTLDDLQQVWSNRDWTLWKVTNSPGIVTGHATLTELEPDHLILNVTSPGRIQVRVRYTKFWTVAKGQACVDAGGPAGPTLQTKTGTPDVPEGQWTSVNALTTGTIELSASVVHHSVPPQCVSPSS